MAISYCLVLWSYHRYVETEGTKIILSFFLAAAWGNLLDEIFFDPYIKSWKEYTAALIVLIYLLRGHIYTLTKKTLINLWHRSSSRQPH